MLRQKMKSGSGNKSRPRDKKLANQGKRSVTFLSIRTQRWKRKLKQGQLLKLRSSLIYFTPRQPNQHSMRLTLANDNEKVRFYTGLPAYDVLQTVLQYVSKFVVRKSPTLSQFREFVLTLMKLKQRFHCSVSRSQKARLLQKDFQSFRLGPLLTSWLI